MREFALLAEVYRHNASLGERILIPPGDDMGMVRFDGRDVLVAVDQLVGDRHVRMETTPFGAIGRKAVNRCLSDIAAMAAKPVATLAAAALPRSFSEKDALELFEGMREAADAAGAPLVGGDIATTDGPLVCSITAFAEPGPRGAVTRGGARPGDLVYVTGTLGGSMDRDTGAGRHLTFEPRIVLALELAERFDLHAMIDLSDGLGRDLDHIAEQSGVRAVIDGERLPLTPGSDWRGALSDGEDYELCFTVAKSASVPDEVAGVSITRIGRIESAESSAARTVIEINDREIDAASFGWEHGA
ncbi:MAG: thiamine-phosphate kinase [Phycisphaerales bacterium]